MFAVVGEELGCLSLRVFLIPYMKLTLLRAWNYFLSFVLENWLFTDLNKTLVEGMELGLGEEHYRKSL